MNRAKTKQKLSQIVLGSGEKKQKQHSQKSQKNNHNHTSCQTLVPMIASRNLLKSFPCNGLVRKSPIISPVGQYSKRTLPLLRVVGYCQNTNLISVTAKTNAVGEQSKTKDVTETKQERLIVTVGL